MLVYGGVAMTAVALESLRYGSATPACPGVPDTHIHVLRGACVQLAERLFVQIRNVHTCILFFRVLYHRCFLNYNRIRDELTDFRVEILID